MANHLAHERDHGIDVAADDFSVHAGASGNRLERAMHGPVGKCGFVVNGDHDAAFVFDRQVPSAANGEASGSRRGDPHERVLPGMDSFARQSGDRESPVLEHADRGVDSPIGARDRELHELTTGKRPRRCETENLPLVHGRHVHRRAFRQDVLGLAVSDKHHADWIVLALVGVQPREEDRREELNELLVADLEQTAARCHVLSHQTDEGWRKNIGRSSWIRQRVKAHAHLVTGSPGHEDSDSSPLSRTPGARRACAGALRGRAPSLVTECPRLRGP